MFIVVQEYLRKQENSQLILTSKVTEKQNQTKCKVTWRKKIINARMGKKNETETEKK